MRLFAGLVLGVFLAGCTAEGLVQSAYPDREIFRFRSMEGETNSYACTKGADARETKARAGRAHQYFDTRLNDIAERFANRVMQDYDAGQGEAAIEREMKVLEREAEKAVNETEARYQCLFFDAAE